MKAVYLILENGTVFTGRAFGAEVETVGEIVFTTAMTGYLETLTDPSYFGQIVLQTFPLIGNYGVIPEDFESTRIGVKGYIVKYPCATPSNFRSMGDLDALLKEKGIPAIAGIDTRQLTRIIRSAGVMNGKITYTKPTAKDQADAKAYSVRNAVQSVSGLAKKSTVGTGKIKIALLDYGAKQGIDSALVERGCTVTRFPQSATAKEVLAIKPDGIMLSNGPGDPDAPENKQIVATVKELFDSGVPMFGICLGHQLLALANGYKTRKMKFGHRGANQPVKDLSDGRVYITSQNHGYEVVGKDGAFINVNDGTCEGMDYGHAFTVQFHPEAHAGPRDTGFLFDRFLERIKKYGGKK